MTKDEIINRIDAAISEMQALKSEVQNIPEENDDNSVPNHLNFNNADYVYYVTNTGLVGKAQFREITHADTAALNKRLFKSLDYAEEFQRKSQFIADLLHFKWLYDRDFTEEWISNITAGYQVFYNHFSEMYECESIRNHEGFTVLFSSGEIAKKCADWLNRRGENNE